jgi:hypothetical protein
VLTDVGGGGGGAAARRQDKDVELTPAEISAWKVRPRTYSVFLLRLLLSESVTVSTEPP